MSARWFGCARRVALVAIAAGTMLLPVSARAAECATLDLTCAAGSAIDTSDPTGDAVSGAQDAVTGAVDDAVDTVKDVTDDPAGDAGQAVDGAGDTARGLLGTNDDRGSGPSDGPGSGGPAAGRRSGRSDGRSGAGASPSSQSIRRLRSGSFVLASALSVSRGPAADPLEGDAHTRPPGFFDSPLGRAVTEVAQRLAFPVALLVIVLAFFVVQHRIDRRSPKLSLARVDRDVVPFS